HSRSSYQQRAQSMNRHDNESKVQVISTTVTHTSKIDTLSLHDARSDLHQEHIGTQPRQGQQVQRPGQPAVLEQQRYHPERGRQRSEEHTSELQSRENLVCRILLEKKKKGTQ